MFRRTSRLSIAALVSFAVAATVSAQTPPQDAELHQRLGLGTKVTLVIVFAEDCAACTEAADFYRELAALPVMDGKAGRLTFLTTTAPVPARRWFESQKLVPHRLLGYPRSSTISIADEPPTVVLLDGRGTTIRRWKGDLTPDVRRQVMEAIAPQSPPRIRRTSASEQRLRVQTKNAGPLRSPGL